MLLLTFLLVTFASHADTLSLPPPTARPLFRVARVSADGTLLQLDDQVLDRILHRSKPGDLYVIPLPDADASLAFDHESIDPKKDLDCCSVTLISADGEAHIPLTRRLSVRDFEIRLHGKTYRVRAEGNGNYLVR